MLKDSIEDFEATY